MGKVVNKQSTDKQQSLKHKKGGKVKDYNEGGKVDDYAHGGLNEGGDVNKNRSSMKRKKK